jgi:hypothetical protein|nr:hypothetical protein [uncultured Acetatifactor sp.]
MPYKRDEAARYGVNERSIQGDIDDIRDFLEMGMRVEGTIGTEKGMR